MELVTIADIVTRFPDFKVVSADVIQFAINESALFVSGSAWQDNLIKARQAQMFVTAHKLASEWFQTAEIASAAAGIASGQSSGGRGGSFGASDFESTHYGRQYLALKRSLIHSPLVVYD